MTRSSYRFTTIFIVLLMGATLIVWLVQPWRVLSLRGYRLEDDSMAPTLVAGDSIMADEFAYTSARPQRGDVVLEHHPAPVNGAYLKRVIAIGGDEIRGDDKGIWLNGKLLNEPYVFKGADGKPVWGDPFDAVQVPAGSVFLLGDQRDASFDSRHFGAIPVGRVFAKASFVYWSRDRSRIGRVIH